MKKLYFIPLSLLFATTSCGDGNHENTIEGLQNEANMVIEDGANDIYEYNDALLAEMTLIEVEFVKVADIDEQDIAEEEFIREVEKSLDIIAQVQSNLEQIEPYGSGGEGFLTAVKEFAAESEILMKLYLGYSEQLSIPDAEWSEDDIDEFLEIFEPAELAYDDAYNNINDKQSFFASMNGTSVEEEVSFDAQEIYDELKEK